MGKRLKLIQAYSKVVSSISSSVAVKRIRTIGHMINFVVIASVLAVGLVFQLCVRTYIYLCMFYSFGKMSKPNSLFQLTLNVLYKSQLLLKRELAEDG